MMVFNVQLVRVIMLVLSYKYLKIEKRLLLLLSIFLGRRTINKRKMSATPSRRSPGQPGYDPNLVEVKSKVSLL